MANASFTHLVVVGSSAGGIEALSELVSSLPDDFPAPIVIAQHLDPARESNLREILSRHSALPVRTVTEHAPLEAGVVFVVPADRHVNITDSELDLRVDAPGRPKPSVDLLMSSAAEVYGERLIAVVLTGTGSDGTEGARAVRRAGGTVVIQDPDTAAFGGMPGSLAPSTVDITAGLDRIGPILKDLLSDSRILEEPRDEDEKQYLERFLEELRERYGMDFTSYKTPTITRRLKRRMVATESDSIEDYRRYLDDYPEEYRQLINSFLIKVTEFFRDPELFDYLREDILPQLIEQAREEGRQIRIWSAGCATGEEAYSLAILLSEVLGDEAGLFNARIFATDVDEEAVDFARRGVYPASALEGLSEEQVSRYFIEESGQYQVKKQVRSIIIFGEHDLGRRSPFPRIDLVVSRNVLIYFAPELQRRSLQLFAYSLRDGGYLVLGKAETPSPLDEFYAPENKQLRVYRRQGERFLMPPPVPVNPVPNTSRLGYGQGAANFRASRELPAESRRTARAPDDGLLNRLPVGVVVVDRRYDIRSINATARSLLSIRGAAIGEDLLHATREMPYEEVRHAIDSAFRNGESAGTEEFPVQEVATGGSRHLRLICHPLRAKDESGRAETVVIAIQDITEEVRARRELEEQLEEARSKLERLESTTRAETARRETQTERLVETNRQLEEANQELSALNEELETLNEEALLSTEEAQAATEEVETLNEELQATNEELETLNEELQATIEELNTTNDDLSARSTELQDLARTREEERRTSEAGRRRLEEILTQAPSMMAMLRGPEHVFEFANLNYTRGVDRTEEMLLGKTIREAFPELEGQGFYDLLDRVYESGEPYVATEALVRLDRDGVLEDGFFDFIYQPLRNVEGEVDGTVVQAIDRTEQVRSRRLTEEIGDQLRDERARLEAILQGMSHAVLAVNESGEALFGNDLFKETFGDGADLSDGFAPLSEDGEQLPPEGTPQARAARGESFEMRFAVEENGERRSFEARGRPIEGGGGLVVIREV